MRAAKVQASLRIRTVSPKPPLLAHTSSESRGTFRQKARSLAPLNGWACAVKICHDGMLKDTDLLDAPHFIVTRCFSDTDTFFISVKIEIVHQAILKRVNKELKTQKNGQRITVTVHHNRTTALEWSILKY